MMEVVIVAVAATLGNLLVGWDSSTIAGWPFILSLFCHLIMLCLLFFHLCVYIYLFEDLKVMYD